MKPSTKKRNPESPTPVLPLERVVWAVDPFAEDPATERRTGAALAHLEKSADALRVQPVYLVPSPEDAVLGSQSIDARSPWGQRTLRLLADLVKKAKLRRAETPRLLTQPGNSIQLATAELVTYARTENASAIAVGTHSRRGAARFFLGSFAETLVLSSPLPLLVVNPRAESTRAPKRILFPTDFSDGSREAFAWVRALSRQLGAELHIFHRTLLGRDPSRAAFEPPAVPEELWMRLQEGRLSTGRRWLEEARSAGLSAELHVSRSRASVADAVSAAAKRLAPCLVVVASHGNTATARLLGSVARQLVRDAPCPVLVLPPKALK